MFKTPIYDHSIAADNFRDYLIFINKVGGRSVALSDKSVNAHELTLDERSLLCLHECFGLG